MKYLLILLGVLVLLVLIAVVRTLVSPRKTSDYQPPQMRPKRCGWPGSSLK